MAAAAGRSRSRSPRAAGEARGPPERGFVWQRDQVCSTLSVLAAEQRCCHTCLEPFTVPADGQRVDFPVVPGCGHAVHGRCLASQIISVNDDIQGKCGMCRGVLVLKRRDRMLVYITALVQFVGSMKAHLREGERQEGLGLHPPTVVAASRYLAEFCVKLYSRIGKSLDLPGPTAVLHTMGMSLDEDCGEDDEIHSIMEAAHSCLRWSADDDEASESSSGEASVA